MNRIQNSFVQENKNQAKMLNKRREEKSWPKRGIGRLPFLEPAFQRRLLPPRALGKQSVSSVLETNKNANKNKIVDWLNENLDNQFPSRASIRALLWLLDAQAEVKLRTSNQR